MAELASPTSSQDFTGLAWDHPDPFILPLTVTPELCDALGHMNNAAYVAWQDEVAWAHSAHLGFNAQGYVDLGVGYVVHENTLRYLLPLQQGEKVALATWVSGNDGRLRCERTFQYIRLRDGETAFRAVLTYVSFDLRRQKITRTPKALAQAYAPWQRDPAPIL